MSPSFHDDPYQWAFEAPLANHGSPLIVPDLVTQHDTLFCMDDWTSDPATQHMQQHRHSTNPQDFHHAPQQQQQQQQQSLLFDNITFSGAIPFPQDSTPISPPSIEFSPPSEQLPITPPLAPTPIRPLRSLPPWTIHSWTPPAAQTYGNNDSLRPSPVPIQPPTRLHRASISYVPRRTSSSPDGLPRTLSGGLGFTGPASAPARPSPLARGFSSTAYVSRSGKPELGAESIIEPLAPRKRRKSQTPSSVDVSHSPAPYPIDSHHPKSPLRPPKLAPSTWQIYFTEWIAQNQGGEDGGRKLNVAQAAKEAGAQYALLSQEEKEPYKQRSAALKEARNRELNAWLRNLSPDEIRRENEYRTAQRKAGKSRKANIKDPNAPKKPLSAYFMFLQRIRSDPQLVQAVFGDEQETTKQSVLAAKKWRSMTDEERKPFLAQAEHEKLEYEAARKRYEGSTSFMDSGSQGTFTVLSPADLSSIPGIQTSPPFKLEKEDSDSDFDIEDS